MPSPNAKPLTDNASAARALIVAPAWIGDAVMAQVLFMRLKARIPGLAIDALAPPWVAPVLRRMPEIDGISAGGMPTRVKCLHVLVGHSLAAGPSVNPLGDEAVATLGEFWARPCLAEHTTPDHNTPDHTTPDHTTQETA